MKGLTPKMEKTDLGGLSKGIIVPKTFKIVYAGFRHSILEV